jgi:hypothetical protein
MYLTQRPEGNDVLKSLIQSPIQSPTQKSNRPKY